MPFDSNLTPDGGVVTVTGSSVSTILGPCDVTSFSSVAIQLSGTFNAVVLWEVSNDESNPTNWQQISGLTSVGSYTGSVGAPQLIVVPTPSRWFRLRISAYTSGTVVAGVLFSTDTFALPASSSTTATLAAGTALVGYVSGGVQSGATNALTPGRITSGASGVIKASVGRVYGWSLINTSAAIKYLQLYAKATAGVPGTDTPNITIPLPANGSSFDQGLIGVGSATGIAWAITTDAAGATAGTAGDIVGTVYYG